MKKIFFAALWILFVAFILPLSAQVAPDTEKEVKPLRVGTALEFTRVSSTDTLSSMKEKETWAVALDTAISRSKRVISVQRSTSGNEPDSLVSRSGFDLLVLVSVQLDTTTDLALVTYRFVDVISKKTLAEEQITGPIPLAYELAQTYWLPLLVSLEKIEITERHSSIRIQAQPGTQVYGFSKTPYTIGGEGELRIEIFIPGTYSWHAINDGMLGQSGIFTAFEDDLLLVIPYKKLTRWTLETGLVMAQFPDFWFGIHNVYNRFFFRLGIEQYLIGLYFPELDTPDSYNQGLVSLPMIMPGIKVGGYFGDTAQFIRPYLSASLFLRYNMNLGLVDPVGPIATNVMAGFDWRVKPSFALFGEAGLSLYPASNGLLMAASRGTQESGSALSTGISVIVYGDNHFLELPIFRLGARFSL